MALAAAERAMKAVLAKTNLKVTTQPRDCDATVIDYSTNDDGFAGDWMGLYDDEIDDDTKRDALEPILRKFRKRIVAACGGQSDDDEEEEEEDSYEGLLDWLDEGEHLYDGHRDLYEPILRHNWDRIADDFVPIPEETAKWYVMRVEGLWMPVLRDETHTYLSLPSSAYHLPRTKELVLPTPYQSRKNLGGDDDIYGIWFESQDSDYALVASEAEGGTYVMGLDDDVLIFCVDGPGDCVRARWKCTHDQWERMWLSAFGSSTIRIDDQDDGNGDDEDESIE